MIEDQNEMKNSNNYQEKIKGSNSSRFESITNIINNMMVFDLLYLIIGEILIIILLPNKLINSIGFLAGVLISVAFSLITKYTIITSIKAQKNFSIIKIVITYIFSLLLIFAILYFLHIYKIGNLFATLAGVLSFSFSIMFQSIIGKVIKRF